MIKFIAVMLLRVVVLDGTKLCRRRAGDVINAAIAAVVRRRP